jgi:hypothetical protein
LKIIRSSSNPLKKKLLKYLSYFDIFEHPLTKAELMYLSGSTSAQVEEVLDELTRENGCYQFQIYYSLQPCVEKLATIRLAKEKQAQHYFKKLPRYAKLISRFPFVSGIAISGSLSKGVMHDDGDIDYFIITKPGRLWICRTSLVVFKKIFLFNSKKYFCVNYFVDENNLLLLDKNMFTAIETAHLLPVYDFDLIERFKKTNQWSNEFVGAFEHPLKVNEVSSKRLMGRFVQFILKGKLGDRLDLFLMKFTYRRWGKKFKHFDAKKFELTMRSNRGVSKHHPRDFQNKVLTAFNERIQTLNLDE